MSDDHDDHELTDMYELLDALEAAIASAEPAKVKALAQTIAAYHDDFPEDFGRGAGAHAAVPPVLRH